MNMDLEEVFGEFMMNLQKKYSFNNFWCWFSSSKKPRGM